MKLVNVYIEGYKRFQTRCKIDLNGPLIAIVGSNEAGKSSLLRGIYRLQDRDPFKQDEPTRRTKLDQPAEVIKSSFLLDEDDRAAIADHILVQDPPPRWFHLTKLGSGELRTELEPRPRRDLAARHSDLEALTQFVDANADILAEDESEPALIDEDELREVKEAWATNHRVLSSEAREVATRVAEAIRKHPAPEAEELAERLVASVDRESQKHPHDAAAEVLYNRSPDFLYFDEASRNLATEYELSDFGDDVPAALANLARLADLNIIEFRQAMQDGDSAYVAEQLNAANANLTRVFRSWNQFDVSVQFDKGDGTLLIIHVSTDTGGLSRFDERSDGLKMFVALVAMVATKPGTTPPIVLIDEVEQHLHYDAEADLIKFFGEQEAAAQIIYTTHSAGCLPGDLGTGVRVVKRVPDTNRSEILNRFWVEGQGYHPLLYAMGAATLSFVPLRDAVIAEGASELILLPSLLREATGSRVLPFHVVPGIAEVRPARIAGLDLEGPRVVYLLDSDRGGRKHIKKFTDAGIEPERIMTLGDDEVVLEDLVDADVYVRAVNETIRLYSDLEFPADALSAPDRPRSVAEWCESKGIKEPAKISVCHAIVEQRAEHPLVDRAHADRLRQLYDDLVSALDTGQ